MEALHPSHEPQSENIDQQRQPQQGPPRSFGEVADLGIDDIFGDNTPEGWVASQPASRATRLAEQSASQTTQLAEQPEPTPKERAEARNWVDHNSPYGTLH